MWNMTEAEARIVAAIFMIGAGVCALAAIAVAGTLTALLVLGAMAVFA